MVMICTRITSTMLAAYMTSYCLRLRPRVMARAPRPPPPAALVICAGAAEVHNDYSRGCIFLADVDAFEHLLRNGQQCRMHKGKSRATIFVLKCGGM